MSKLIQYQLFSKVLMKELLMLLQLEMQQARYLERMLGYDAEKMNEFLSKIPVGGGGGRTGKIESKNGIEERKENGDSGIVKFLKNTYNAVLDFFGLGSKEKIPEIAIDVENVKWGIVKDEKEFGKDKTEDFNKHLSNIDKIFTSLSSTSTNPIERVGVFALIQLIGAHTDFLNPKQSENYKYGGFFDGKFMNGDDFGNFSYGYAAKSIGIDPITTIFGAGAFTTINNIYHWNFRTSDFTNPFFFDEKRDSKMVWQGYFWKEHK